LNDEAPDAEVIADGSTQSRSSANSRQDAEPPDEGVARGAVVSTTIVCATLAVAGHIVLYLAFIEALPFQLVWQPVVGAVLSSIGIVAFGGFYLATRRARIAIASSFLLTFIVTLTFVATIGAFAANSQLDGVRPFFDDLRNIVQTIIIAYFGSETVISALKVGGVAWVKKNDPNTSTTAIQTADRDLVPHARVHTVV
jgi:hypothetical protein